MSVQKNTKIMLIEKSLNPKYKRLIKLDLDGQISKETERIFTFLFLIV